MERSGKKSPEERIKEIEEMEHEDMARLWRYAPVGHYIFDENLPYHEIFKERFFNHFGGFTPEISKKIGR